MSEKRKTILIAITLILLVVGVFLLVGAKSQLTLLTDSKKSVSSNAQKPDQTGQDKLNISFWGDVMLDRSVRQTIDGKGLDYILTGSHELFSQTDFNVANLEGPVAEKDSVAINTKEGEKNHLTFVFDKKSLPVFKQNKFKVLFLGNNHILNFGQDGLRQTKENLEQNQIKYFGEPKAENYLLWNNDGLKIAWVGYNQFETDSLEKTINQIKQAKNQVDLVLVYTHWGVEYKNVPTENQKNLAHQFVDSGADAVIGTHPHVVQSIEKYHDKYIFYSLGNFIFDQLFSEETRTGLNVVMQYDRTDQALNYRLNFIYMGSGLRLQTLTSEKLKTELNNLAEISWGAENLSQQIRDGVLR